MRASVTKHKRIIYYPLRKNSFKHSVEFIPVVQSAKSPNSNISIVLYPSFFYELRNVPKLRM